MVYQGNTLRFLAGNTSTTIALVTTHPSTLAGSRKNCSIFHNIGGNLWKSINQTHETRKPTSVLKRFRRSRGSVLAFGTQVRGFKPGPKPSDFSGRLPRRGSKTRSCIMSQICGMYKNPKSSVNSLTFRPNLTAISLLIVPSFTARFTGVICDVQNTWWCKLERLRFRVVQ
jgi:hypothetical protein